ncbi:MAG: UbiA prenyltransferase [Rhodobacteraceae bacterium HLUCCA08]|nr:MAG: UbiA prenyltransferase [Rhodobacteraceae bacterium HLUCCA08]
MPNEPLVLDADGTLLRTDMLLEGVLKGLGTDPRGVFGALRLLPDRAAFKAEIARIAPLRVDLLPVNQEVLEVALAARAEGREVVLASASDRALVEPLARQFGIDTVFASGDGVNLKGSAKAAALVEAYGKGGFYYAGDARADHKVWAHAAGAVVVGDPGGARAMLEAQGKPVRGVEGGWSPRALFKAIRPHQWVKNVLLFLPMLAAHAFELPIALLVLAGIAAFSCAASSIYIVNDLLDLEADRLHETKHRRPFAAGTVPIPVGMATSVALGLAALVIGASLGPAMLGVVALYMALSLAYSMRLKRMRWVDVATLAALYTLRVVAGAAASGVEASIFMLIFIFPVFLTLGCVKRLTELARAETDDRLPGRGYGRADRGDLVNVAGLGMVGALVIFFLYSWSDQALALYPDQWIMWIALVPIAAWLYRMIRLGYWGRMDYDPIVFALRDKRGIGFLLIALALMFYSAGLWTAWWAALTAG